VHYFVVVRGGYPVGLVALVIGYVVARGVQFGAAGRRGPVFQLTAIALTYLALVGAYVPFADLASHATPLAILRAMASPLMAGLTDPPTSLINIGLVIFALLPGWLMLRMPTRLIEGPFRVGEPGSTATDAMFPVAS
jgi:hypothetical protein